MSSDALSYLLYMQTWDDETDENINAIICEHKYFLMMDGIDASQAVEKEFKILYDQACTVRDEVIAADSVQIAADAAAIASVISFGLGMAAFTALEAAELGLRIEEAKEAKALNEKFTSIDNDIAEDVGPDATTYIDKFKENNNLIASKAAKGTDVRHCRANLMQFLAEVEKRETLTADSFRKYAHAARKLYEGEEINKIYDALDKLNFSDKTDNDVKDLMDVLADLKVVPFELSLVTGISVAIMFNKLNVAQKTIKSMAKEAGVPVEEVGVSAFNTMDAVGKFVTGAAVLMSLVDVFLQVLDIVDAVEKYKSVCDQIENKYKPGYLAYWTGLPEASKLYKKAIAPE
jgi:hypothetical protein